MKIYSPCEMIRKEKQAVYNNLKNLNCSGFEIKKTLSQVYSLKGELLFRPLRLGVMIYLRKKNWLNKEEFETGLECLVG